MNKNIIYITFVDFTDQKSGSSVRPKKIYDEFVREGFNISLLTGLHNRKRERWKNAWKLYKEIKDKDYDFCYVEPPAGPFFNLCDHLLLLYIANKKKVPIGLFYRDAYWKFADWYEVKGIKRKIIVAMHKFDWKIMKKACKRIYFPSKTMGDLFEFKDKEPLPPGCEPIVVEKDKSDSIEMIYVGGMSEQYGGKLLLETMDKLNKEKRMNLHLVCREADNEKLKGYEDREWLKVYNASGDELKKIYRKANIAIIPRKVDFYMDFAMPVKLFEYVSYELPVISTNCKEVAKFIESNNIGKVCRDNEESLLECLKSLTMDEVEAYTENVRIAKENNTWSKRIEQITRLAD